MNISLIRFLHIVTHTVMDPHTHTYIPFAPCCYLLLVCSFVFIFVFNLRLTYEEIPYDYAHSFTHSHFYPVFSLSPPFSSFLFSTPPLDRADIQYHIPKKVH